MFIRGVEIRLKSVYLLLHVLCYIIDGRLGHSEDALLISLVLMKICYSSKLKDSYFYYSLYFWHLRLRSSLILTVELIDISQHTLS
jgi:hypothetical protein